MDPFEQKSILYFEASQRIIDSKDNLHCSIALSYYAVFVYMKYLLSNLKKDSLSNEDLLFRNGNPHKDIIDRIISIVPKEGQWFKDEISKLHDLRNEADYKERIFSLDEAMAVHAKAIQIKSKLKYYFNYLIINK